MAKAPLSRYLSQGQHHGPPACAVRWRIIVPFHKQWRVPWTVPEEVKFRNKKFLDLQQLYADIFNDWMVANEEAAEELRWRAVAIDRYLKQSLRGSQLNFIDAFAAFRDWEMQHPEETSNFIQELPEETVAEFAKNPATANFVRDLAFASFRPEQLAYRNGMIRRKKSSFSPSDRW